MNRQTIPLPGGGKVIIDPGNMDEGAANRLIEAIEFAAISTLQAGEGNSDFINFLVTSNFGHRTQLPFVSVTVAAKNFVSQMSPDEARSLAGNLLACAEAAEGDAILIRYLREKVGVTDPATLAQVLVDFRKIREEITAKQAE